MTYKNLINNGFGSQFRKEKRQMRNAKIVLYIAYFFFALTIIYAFYSVDIIVSRVINIMM